MRTHPLLHCIVASTSLIAAASAFAQAAPSPATAPATPPATAPAVQAATDAVEKTRLEKMLAEGDDGMIIQIFRRHPSKVLPFIDSYLEGGLAMIEKSGDAAGALASYRTGMKFAKLADEALRVQALSEYANAFAGWSPTEQKTFREGQKAFREGMKAMKAATPDYSAAISHFERSRDLASSLGDTWGRAMALGGIAEAGLKAGRLEEAHDAAIEGIELNYQVRLMDDLVQLLMTCARIRHELQLPDAGVGHLRQAWMYVENDFAFDAATRSAVLQEFLAALERTGRKDEAQKLRKQQGL